MKNEDATTQSVADNETDTVSAPIVLKRFIAKNGEVTDYEEFYVQLSVDDYFIKFCESSMDREEFEQYFSGIQSEIKVATLEIEFREGAWDICDGSDYKQSRMGQYVVIHKIVDDE